MIWEVLLYFGSFFTGCIIGWRTGRLDARLERASRIFQSDIDK